MSTCRASTWKISCGQHRQSLKTRSKKEARRKALIKEKEILVGEHKHGRRAPSIGEVIEQYVEYLKAEQRSAKTISKYQFCFRILLRIATDDGIKRISRLDIALLDRFRAKRVAGGCDHKPAKPKTVHNDTVTIRQLVNFAIRRGMIIEDPLKGLQLKKPKRTPQPCWSRDEVDQILKVAKEPHLQPLVFLAETGARVGEAKWLEWNDVDFDHRLIHIRPKEGWKPKSGDERVIPMSDTLFETISSMPNNGKWVFNARITKRNPETGRQISERRLLQHLKRVLKRLGLQGHLHTFRHSSISFAAYEGTSERVLRKWIGHVDREILDWYFHLADSQSAKAMKRLSDAAERNRVNKPAQKTESNSAHFQHTRKDEQNDQVAI